MSYQVKLIKSARQDLALAKEFYSKTDVELGRYCASSLLLDIKRLAFYAGIHIKEYGYYRMLSRTFPFSIYYEVIGNQVVVIAVLDNRRNPQNVIQRLLAK